MNPTPFQQSTSLAVGLMPSENNQNSNGRPTPNRTGLSSFPNRLAVELTQFNKLASEIRRSLQLAHGFEARCQQAFDLANDLFGNAPTWVCFYRELMGGSGLIVQLFPGVDDFGRFLRSDQYHQIQMMLTALRSRDLPENDPNDPQRMITVRLPKSLHEAMCEEAGRLNISVNRLCISRMLQLLDPKMIPETQSKPRGRKPRTRSGSASSEGTTECGAIGMQVAQSMQNCQTPQLNNPSGAGQLS